ncbi:MAG: 4Fe-4S binding protein [Candidatus Moduliflexus flocculans]|nr:4Fe-4S binding protein [Candidatus Moduliflexus flocculans]
MVAKPGVVTLKYPFEPRPAPENFRGAPHWDHTKCIGCGGCANHCPARTIMVRDLCQEIRVLLYDGSRCTYCGRCADVCPEKAIAMSDRFEQATDDRNDITETLELFMLTCQRCGRCYDMETDERPRQARPDGLPLRQPGSPDGRPPGDGQLPAEGARRDRALRAAGTDGRLTCSPSSPRSASPARSGSTTATAAPATAATSRSSTS